MGKAVQVESKKELFELVQRHYAPGASEQTIEFLLSEAKANGLDPRKKECHFVKMKTWNPDTREMEDKWSMQISIDMFRKRGMRTKMVDGHDSRPYWIDKDGKMQEWANIPRLTAQKRQPEYPDLGQGIIYHKAMKQPIIHTVYWQEYARFKKDGSLMKMWAKMPGLMLSKCAEAGAWRKAFPDEFGGLYSTDEMEQAQNPKGALPKQNLVEFAPKPKAAEPSKTNDPVKQPKQPPQVATSAIRTPPDATPSVEQTNQPVRIEEKKTMDMYMDIKLQFESAENEEQLQKIGTLNADGLGAIGPDLYNKIIAIIAEKRKGFAQAKLSKPKDQPEYPSVDTQEEKIEDGQINVLAQLVGAVNNPKVNAQPLEAIASMFKVTNVRDVPKIRAIKAIAFYAGGANKQHLTKLLANFKPQEEAAPA